MEQLLFLDLTPKCRRKWPESEGETGQNLYSLFTHKNSEISPKYHNQQLEHIEMIEKHTKFKENGGWRSPYKLGEILSKIVQTALFRGMGWD